MSLDMLGRPATAREVDFIAGIRPTMRIVENAVAEIAPTNILMLLIGEIGTGKQVFARQVHSLSRRGDELLVNVNKDAVEPPSHRPRVANRLQLIALQPETNWAR